MIYRVGDVVELAQGASLGLSGSVARGAKGVVLREPGLMSKGYLVRLDAAGRQVELPAEALRRSGDVWSSGPRRQDLPVQPATVVAAPLRGRASDATEAHRGQRGHTAGPADVAGGQSDHDLARCRRRRASAEPRRRRRDTGHQRHPAIAGGGR